MVQFELINRKFLLSGLGLISKALKESDESGRKGPAGVKESKMASSELPVGPQQAASGVKGNLCLTASLNPETLSHSYKEMNSS